MLTPGVSQFHGTGVAACRYIRRASSCSCGKDWTRPCEFWKNCTALPGVRFGTVFFVSVVDSAYVVEGVTFVVVALVVGVLVGFGVAVHVGEITDAVVDDVMIVVDGVVLAIAVYRQAVL